jgi:hypothetical protein
MNLKHPLVKEYCRLENRENGCKEAFGCGVDCPLAKWFEVYEKICERAIPVRVAWDEVNTGSIPSKMRNEIIVQAISGIKPDYPRRKK